jgi:GDPmannose 4,6-dehydratase
LLLKGYHVFGLYRNNPNKELLKIDGVTYIESDLSKLDSLDVLFSDYEFDEIYNLGAQTFINPSWEHPEYTFNVNCLSIIKLLNYIKDYSPKTKLFNASSSEIYKGHIEYIVKEDDTHKFHNHPYSIAKIMGHSMVDFYRETHGLPFSNGIFFTTESEKKRPDFLLNKIKIHAKSWKNTLIPLKVGPLVSFRNILHAHDVASAISIIVKQPYGANYLICNDFSVKIFDLVLNVYKNNGILLHQKDNILYDKETNLPVVYIDKNIGNETNCINIQGECSKLKELGWTIKYSIDDILSL